MALNSFGQEITAAVFGASGGIGSALVEALQADPAVARVHSVSRTGDTDHHCDYRDESSIEGTACAIAADGPVHLVIVSVGVLQAEGIAPEKTWKALDAGMMAKVFEINTVIPTMIAKHMLPTLAKGRKTALAALSARVGSIADNRLGGWLSYRTSKAALNMSIRTLSIELARVNREAMIVGLHPGTVETNLSQPFRNNVPDEQLFTPSQSAAKLLATLDGVSANQSGKVFAYDGEEISP